MSKPYLILAAVWIGWCVLHSIMISTPAVRSVEKRPWRDHRYYRLFFNVVSLATLAPIVAYMYTLKGEPVWRWTGMWSVVPWVLLVVAAVLFIGGARHYDMKQFLGLRQLDRREPVRALTESGRLKTNGMLGITRHPWYAGAIALLWATDLTKARLITNVILTVYLIVGVFLEERKLVGEYGDAYRIYQKRVPMLLPLGFIRRAQIRR
jgi:protein-S-isoprenylcysteine O-methyltransferase Ste14